MTRTRGTRALGRMQAADVLTLIAVGLVVLLVSLPCLRDFAVRENERDARRLLPHLADLVGLAPEAAGDPAGAAPRKLDPLELGGLFAARPALVAGLPDARAGADGRTLRHHGYVFAGLCTAAGQRIALFAWPWDHGRTGELAYLFVPGRGLFEHQNAAGRWSGASGPRPDELGALETSAGAAGPLLFPPAPASGGWSACTRVERADP